MTTRICRLALQRLSRRAMALPAVLLLVFVGLGIAIAIRQFSSETYRRTSRGTYATMSEVLAESAAEEAWYTLQRDVNTPGTDLFRLFRDVNDFRFNCPLPVLKGKLSDPQFGGYLTDRYDAGSSFAATIDMNWTNPYGSKMQGVSNVGEIDPQTTWERVGVVTIRGSAQAASRADGLANFRRMVIKRPFRIVKVSPPVPFDRSGLIILYPEHVTDVQVAGVLDQATNYAMANGGKAKLTPLLEKANRFVDEASGSAKKFQDAYKFAVKPPFGGHMVSPPKWLQKLIDQAGGLLNKATKLDLAGQGRRPFLFNDQVMIARSSMKDGVLGNLADFNYGRNIKDKLGPLVGVMDALQKVVDINTTLMETLGKIHVFVPYGTALDVMVAPLYAIVPEVVGTVRGVCEKLHDLMDPVLEISVGLGQVLAILQKIIVEVPMMGQQAFAGFANQVAGAAGDNIDVGQITGAVNMANEALQGLPTNTPAMAFALDMPLPNYATGDDQEKMVGFNAGQIIEDAAGGFLKLVVGLVEKELVKLVTEQIAELTAKILVATTVTAAACAGPQALVACGPAKLAIAAAFEIIQRAVLQNVMKQLDRVKSLKGDMLGAVVKPIVSQIPVLKTDIMQKLQLEALLGSVLQAAYEKTDLSDKVEEWLNTVLTTFATETQNAVKDGLGVDKIGGVLKGYVLRHRFRNLVEFDGSGSMGSGFGFQPAGGAQFASTSSGGPSGDGLNAWRNAFDRVYKETTWAKKATWKITKKDEWDALLSRYFEGVYLKGKDPSGDGTAAWQADSYAPNKDYGLSGIVYYTGTEDLTIDFSGARNFIGKCVIYVPKAKVNVVSCKMRDITKDCLTVICARPIQLPPSEVEISVHAIGNALEDCQVLMSTSTKILGSVILKRYASSTESNDATSLKGELTYNARLNGMGGAFSNVDANHLFVTVSPYIISREMETQP